MGSNYAGNVSLPGLQSTQISPTIGNIQQGVAGLSPYQSTGTNVLPQAYQTEANLYSNPYAGQALQGAQGAAALGTPAAYAGYNTGAQLTGAGLGLVPYAQQIMQTGFDPQQALYSRTLQQVQDQSNVNNAMAGVATSPYGAGLTNQATANFNIDWQNQQLARQAQAASAAGGLTQTGAGVAGQGVGMMQQAPNALVQSATIPYATYSDIGTGQNQAISQLLGLSTSGANLQNLPVQDYLNLLSGQNQSNTVANQTGQLGLNQAQLGWNQLAQLGSGLGSAAGWASSFL